MFGKSKCDAIEAKNAETGTNGVHVRGHVYLPQLEKTRSGERDTHTIRSINSCHKKQRMALLKNCFEKLLQLEV